MVPLNIVLWWHWYVMDGKFQTCVVIIEAEPYPVHILNIPLESDVLPRSTV